MSHRKHRKNQKTGLLDAGTMMSLLLVAILLALFYAAANLLAEARVAVFSHGYPHRQDDPSSVLFARIMGAIILAICYVRWACRFVKNRCMQIRVRQV